MQLALVGRYKNAADLENVTVTVRGKSGRESHTYAYRGLEFPLRAENSEFLPRLWASRRVGWLIEQIRLNGETKELRDEVVDLGTRFGLVTPYTSYLATDGSVANATTPSGLQTLLRAAPAKLAKVDGADAVQMSVQQNTMQMNTMVAESEKKEARARILVGNSKNNQFFGNKNFTNENNVWVDSEYSAAGKLKENTLKFASDEYFRLAAAEPELARYFSLGEEVVVVWRNQVYRVVK
jgi:Ca-activated chloride channel homolog